MLTCPFSQLSHVCVCVLCYVIQGIIFILLHVIFILQKSVQKQCSENKANNRSLGDYRERILNTFYFNANSIEVSEQVFLLNKSIVKTIDLSIESIIKVPVIKMNISNINPCFTTVELGVNNY